MQVFLMPVSKVRFFSAHIPYSLLLHYFFSAVLNTYSSVKLRSLLRNPHTNYAFLKIVFIATRCLQIKIQDTLENKNSTAM